MVPDEDNRNSLSAGLHQAPRQVEVVLARRHVAGRVIVRKNHTRMRTAIRRL